MRIAIPTQEGVDLDAVVCEHLGRAPLLTLVDSESGELQVVRGLGDHEGHGACGLGPFLASHGVGAVVAVQVGRGALRRLAETGVRVLAAKSRVVADIVREAREGSLRPVLEQDVACHGGRCRH
jgi:predicted Fe-Mo cluster-binding NifX family protein